MIVFVPYIYPARFLVLIKFEEFHHQRALRNIGLVDQCFAAGHNDPDRTLTSIAGLLEATYLFEETAVHSAGSLQYLVITVKY